MNYGKYLPLGTVVLLKEAKKRIMIIGFCCSDSADTSKVYDYSGCMYPEGVIAANKTLLFNHDQIDKIYHLGLVDDEEKQFKNKLNEFLGGINKQ